MSLRCLYVYMCFAPSYMCAGMYFVFKNDELYTIKSYINLTLCGGYVDTKKVS